MITATRTVPKHVFSCPSRSTSVLAKVFKLASAAILITINLCGVNAIQTTAADAQSVQQTQSTGASSDSRNQEFAYAMMLFYHQNQHEDVERIARRFAG